MREKKNPQASIPVFPKGKNIPYPSYPQGEGVDSIARHSTPLPYGGTGRWSVGVCLLTLLLVFFVSACHKETKPERYAREARETTAQCPMAIDANTVMDSMTYTSTTHRFTYYYMVSGIADSILKADEEMFRQQILERLMNSTDMLPYIQDNVTFRYVYRTSATSAPVMDFVYESLKGRAK